LLGSSPEEPGKTAKVLALFCTGSSPEEPGKTAKVLALFCTGASEEVQKC